MKLITKELEARFKEIGSQEDKPLQDHIVVVKFFNPQGRGTWYLTEYDPESQIAFGYVSIFGDWNDEWGDFAVHELQEMKLPPFGLGIERDKHWEETKASEVEDIKKSFR